MMGHCVMRRIYILNIFGRVKAGDMYIAIEVTSYSEFKRFEIRSLRTSAMRAR